MIGHEFKYTSKKTGGITKGVISNYFMANEPAKIKSCFYENYPNSGYYPVKREQAWIMSTNGIQYFVSEIEIGNLSNADVNPFEYLVP